MRGTCVVRKAIPLSGRTGERKAPAYVCYPPVMPCHVTPDFVLTSLDVHVKTTSERRCEKKQLVYDDLI
jgi:hypothetical protein